MKYSFVLFVSIFTFISTEHLGDDIDGIPTKEEMLTVNVLKNNTFRVKNFLGSLIDSVKAMSKLQSNQTEAKVWLKKLHIRFPTIKRWTSNELKKKTEEFTKTRSKRKIDELDLERMIIQLRKLYRNRKMKPKFCSEEMNERFLYLNYQIARYQEEIRLKALQIIGLDKTKSFLTICPQEIFYLKRYLSLLLRGTTEKKYVYMRLISKLELQNEELISKQALVDIISSGEADREMKLIYKQIDSILKTFSLIPARILAVKIALILKQIDDLNSKINRIKLMAQGSGLFKEKPLHICTDVSYMCKTSSKCSMEAVCKTAGDHLFPLTHSIYDPTNEHKEGIKIFPSKLSKNVGFLSSSYKIDSLSQEQIDKTLEGNHTLSPDNATQIFTGVCLPSYITEISSKQLEILNNSGLVVDHSTIFPISNRLPISQSITFNNFTGLDCMKTKDCATASVQITYDRVVTISTNKSSNEVSRFNLAFIAHDPVRSHPLLWTSGEQFDTYIRAKSRSAQPNSCRLLPNTLYVEYVTTGYETCDNSLEMLNHKMNLTGMSGNVSAAIIATWYQSQDMGEQFNRMWSNANAKFEALTMQYIIYLNDTGSITASSVQFAGVTLDEKELYEFTNCVRQNETIDINGTATFKDGFKVSGLDMVNLSKKTLANNVKGIYPVVLPTDVDPATCKF
ncbi:hypothetical protein SNEBB_007450 [Seison nebaliae]|nr:hypothetical protein SNEBB_007450 [Seison nebaliae]